MIFFFLRKGGLISFSRFEHFWFSFSVSISPLVCGGVFFTLVPIFETFARIMHRHLHLMCAQDFPASCLQFSVRV